MTTSEVDVLVQDGSDGQEPITLSTGVSVEVNRLKTRETMKLLKILTRGASYALTQLSVSEDKDDFVETLILSIALAIPDAEEETIDFIKVMVRPVGLIDTPRTKADKEINADILAKFDVALTNPELDEMVTIISRIARNEAPHMQELGKTLGLLLKTFRPATS